MNPPVDKMLQIERSLSQERGEFRLFALFLREESPDRWDLVVSAPWMEQDFRGSIDQVARKLQQDLTVDEITTLSRITLIDSGNPELAAILSTFSTVHNDVEIIDRVFFGLAIKHGHIITSQLLAEDTAWLRLKTEPERKDQPA